MRGFFRSIFLMIVTPLSAFAWGQEGHSIVAEIAQRRLSPQAAAMVSTLLGPGVTLGSIASWADDVRDSRPKTYNWHFVSIPIIRATYDPTAHGVAMTVFAETPADNFLDDAYFDKEIGIVDQQLGRAGLRLAKLVNDPVSCQ